MICFRSENLPPIVLPWQLMFSITIQQTCKWKLKLIDRLRATRWTPPDYWQTDNSNGLVMVIRYYHWLNSASRVLISTCSAPLVQTGERKQFHCLTLTFILRPWPTIPGYPRSRSTLMPKIKVKGQTVQTGECPQQTDTYAHTWTNGRTHTWTLPNVLSPLLCGR